jgi:hypothetical protein
MSETKFGTWAPPESSVAIEYSLMVIEEIRQAVLYGIVDGTTVRILAVREMACEHATGPSFHLSEKDLSALTEQLERNRTDPRLEGFAPLGFYVSHTRSDIVLMPGEFEIYNSRFGEPLQVVLVVRPGRAGKMRAGFFVREADGTVKADCSYLDFDFPDRALLPPSPPPAFKERRVREQPSAGPRAEPEDAQEMEPAETISRDVPALPAIDPLRAGPVRVPDYVPVPQPKRKWLAWTFSIAGVLVAAAAAVLGLRYFGHVPAPPLSLNVSDGNSQMMIGWDPTSPTIRTAAKGTLVIVEGNDTQTSKLSPNELASGIYLYTRHTGDVQVSLEVETTARESRLEATRFLGPPPLPVTNDELDSVKRDRDALRGELDRLRDQNAKQAAQIRQLDRSLTILRTRIGIVGPGNAAKK